MPPQFNTTSIPLFKSTGIPAMNAACCCGEPCLCTELKTPPTACQCMNSDFGSYMNRGTATVTVTGSATAYPFSVSVPGCVPACASLTGTYVVPCGTTSMWCNAVFICNDGFFDRYYISFIRIIYQTLSVDGVRVFFGSYLVTVGGGTPPPTSLTAGCIFPFTDTSVGSFPNHSTATHTWDETATHDDWRYNFTGSCTSECNEIVTRRACAQGVKTMSMVSVDSGFDSCKVSDYTVTLEIGPPS